MVKYVEVQECENCGHAIVLLQVKKGGGKTDQEWRHLKGSVSATRKSCPEEHHAEPKGGYNDGD